MNENDFTFKCPKCGVPWRFHFEGASLDTRQATTTDDLDKILAEADVTIDDLGDHYEIRPNHYLGDAFKDIHAKLKAQGARWDSDKNNKANSHWNLPKRS